MATEKTLQCSVITPEQKVFEAAATAVIIPAHDGQIGILPDRAPLLCELGAGTLRVDAVDGGMREFYVDGGFAQVLHNQVTILTEKAAPAEAFSKAAAEKALTEARQMKNFGMEEVQARGKAIARATAQLHLAKK
jgi:F-type H+-transporting ATPase subunit epsilon